MDAGGDSGRRKIVNIRIISGEFGGRRIEAPSNSHTHPMSERIRNALFNSIGDEISGKRVLDAFAGTGSVGIEALSRGAEHVVFVEKDRIAQKSIENNLNLLGAKERTALVSSTVASWLSSADIELFDIIFADPPYNDTQFSTVEKLLGLLKHNGLMVLSHPGRSETPTRPGVVVVDNRSYGSAVLTFYRRDGAV